MVRCHHEDLFLFLRYFYLTGEKGRRDKAKLPRILGFLVINMVQDMKRELVKETEGQSSSSHVPTAYRIFHNRAVQQIQVFKGNKKQRNPLFYDCLSGGYSNRASSKLI